MKIITPIIFVLFFISYSVNAQQNYTRLIAQADSFYRVKDYKMSNENIFLH